MMTKYRWIRHGLAVAGIAALLAGCNGKEDFSDAVIGGDPLGSGVGAGANFQPDDACAPRVIGALVDAGTVSNIRYECDGFYGYTGVTGLPSETSQHFFVCPLGAKSVTFMLGGRTASLTLGTSYFRAAQSINTQGCQYDYGAEEYVIGQYDADGIYLFSVSDLIKGPARIDAESSADTDGKKQVRNTSALLQALDTTAGDELITIDQVAHEIVFDAESPFVFSDNFLIQDYSSFIQGAGEAQSYLDAIQAEGGQVSAAGFPLESGAISALSAANKATNAGVYRFQLIQNSLADAGLVDQGVFTNPVLFGDGLCKAVAAGAINPAESSEDAIDPVLLPSLLDYLENAGAFCSSYSQFMPSMLVTRRGHVSMGGAFNIVDFENGGSFSCDNDTVDYAALDSTSYLFEPDRTFSAWGVSGDREGGALQLNGRLIGDYAFNGEERDQVLVSDYRYVYDGLPETAYNFNPVTDRTSFNGSYCNATVDDQPLLSLLRAGTVTPYLDAEVMGALAEPNPMRYTLNYIARAQATDEEPGVQVASLNITIHSDGAVFTDLNNDGNPYDGISVPSGEYEIGMISSVFRSPVTPEDPSLAVLNILVSNYGPLSLSGVLPKYGSHFRARLVPDNACAGGNVLFAASGEYETATDSAYWFDPYAAADVIRASPGEAGASARYAGLRTRAYGYIEAVRSDCPPPP